MMREDTVTTKVYSFDELSDEAKQAAIQLLADINVNYEWWEPICDDAARIGLGITEFEVDRGAYVRGDWIESAEDAARLILAEHGEVCETYKDAGEFLTDLQAAQTAFAALPDYNPDNLELEDTDEYDELCAEFKQILCEDYRIILQKEYEYLASEEAIIETIQANEYEFTVNGTLYYRILETRTMKLTTKQQQACKAALELITDPDVRVEYMKQHDISYQLMWYYKRDYQRSTMTRTAKSKARVRVLTEQNNRCALCDADIDPNERCCLDKTGKVVCLTCNQFLSLFRQYKADGLTAVDLEAFDPDTFDRGVEQ